MRDSDTSTMIGRLRAAARWLLRLEPFLLLLATPFLILPTRWTPLVLPFLLLPWIARLYVHGRLTRRSPLNAPVLLILLLALAGFAVSPDRSSSSTKLWRIILQTAVFFTAVNVLITSQHLRKVTHLLLALPPAVALVSLLGTDWTQVRLLPLESFYRNIPRLEEVALLLDYGQTYSPPLFHPREVGATLGFLLPFPLAQLIFGRDRRLRLLAGAAALIALIVLILTQATMGLLGVAAALALFALCWRRWTVVPMVGLAALALAIVLLTVDLRSFAASMLDLDNVLGVGFVFRFDIWSRALAMVGDAPLIGIGLNNFPLTLTHFYPGLYVGPWPHAHNLFLQTALDLGLPGLLVLLWLFAAFFILTARAYPLANRPWQRVLLLGVAGSALAYLAGGLMDAITLGAKSVAAVWLMLGVGAAAWRVLREEAGLEPISQTGRRLSYVAGSLVVGLTVLLLVLAPGQPAGNAGLLRAHRAIFIARETGRLPAEEAAAAINTLQQALANRPDDPQLHGLLASLYAWQGDESAALDHLHRRVALDGPQALLRYAPFVRWVRRLRGQAPLPPWAGTIRLYRSWRDRYPERAEPCLLLALTMERRDGREVANDIVLRCQDHGAKPAALVSHYLEQPPSTASQTTGRPAMDETRIHD